MAAESFPPRVSTRHRPARLPRTGDGKASGRWRAAFSQSTLLRQPPIHIKDIHVVETIVGGTRVYVGDGPNTLGR